ncbi:MAG: hypothetical protein IMZ53_05615 [Thermoplasmata archaeon]|nr:hypothetical protein [Thermoplasmata archaeon]
MKLKIALTVIIFGLIITGAFMFRAHATAVNEITVTFTTNGYNQNVSRVTVRGGTANVTYLIKNDTGKTITPVFDSIFDRNPESYSAIEGQGYKIYPEASRYITLPDILPIKSGEQAKYSIILDIPKDDLPNIPDKWAFITASASNTGGFVQVAPGIWWVINMR